MTMMTMFVSILIKKKDQDIIMIRCVACGEAVGEDFHIRGEAACCNKVPQLSLGYQIHS